MKRLFACSVVLIMILGSWAVAQDTVVHANIPFSFSAGGKVLPAGNYEFRVQDDANTVLVKNLLTGEGVLATVATRIAGDPTLKGPARITFDEVNDNHILEAFWPARDDGYLVQVTAVKHKHRINQSGIAL